MIQRTLRTQDGWELLILECRMSDTYSPAGQSSSVDAASWLTVPSQYDDKSRIKITSAFQQPAIAARNCRDWACPIFLLSFLYLPYYFPLILFFLLLLFISYCFSFFFPLSFFHCLIVQSFAFCVSVAKAILIDRPKL